MNKNLKLRKKRKSNYIIDVEINRAEWDVKPNKEILGIINPQGYLLRSESFGNVKCCLGFLGIVCGISKLNLLNRQTPDEVFETPFGGINPIWPASLHAHEEKLMEINDLEEVTSEQREKMIHEEGLKADINFTFVGEYLKKEE